MILAVTPARGGSKGIPRKNLVPLAGKPLLACTIEAAQRSKLLTRYVISTEDREIAETARKYNVDVIERPVHLASDDASTLSVLEHVLSVMPADIIVLLQATSPIRDPGLIDFCIQRFLDTGTDSLATGLICKYVEYGKNEQRRQEIPGFFYDDGNIYVMKAELIKRGERYGTKIERVILDREQNVEIDDNFDLWIAEEILKRRRSIVGRNSSVEAYGS